MDSDFLVAWCHKCKSHTEQSYRGSYRNTVNGTWEHRYRCPECKRLMNHMIIRKSINQINPYEVDSYWKWNKK